MALNVYLTGGAGFIGSHVADALLAAGHRVLIVDDLSSGCKKNVPEGAELSVLDIRDDGAARLLADGDFDVLVHHAAQMDVRRSVEDPRHDADVNVGGFLNLLEAARRGAVRQVVFASTGGAIYGEQETFPADEEHPLRPLSPYGVSKLAGERYLYYYSREHGIDATCLRYANVYGPRQNPHGEAGVVAIFMQRALAGGVPVINGDGRQTRDYVYVDDVVRANLAALGHDGFAVFNVGTGVETDVNTLYGEIRAALNGGPDPDHGPAKPGEQRRSCIASRRLRRELGVEATTTLADGLAATAEWFLRHRSRE